MLFVERDDQGKINSLRRSAATPDQEAKAAVDQEVLEFLEGGAPRDSLIHALGLLDIESIRIIEDLVDLLIAKGVIMITELPEAAQGKLQERKQMRQGLGKSQILVDDIL